MAGVEAGRQWPLADTLRILLPSRTQTWFLRACLHEGDSGRDAWRRWIESVGDARAALRDGHAGGKPLLPLLSHALRRSTAEIDAALAPHLRAAVVTEQVRCDAYRAICASVLNGLIECGVSPIALAGTALADTAYPDPVLRHAHAVELLIRANEAGIAAGALAASGVIAADRPAHPDAPMAFRHPSGLPIVLHTRLLRSPLYDLPADAVWVRRQPARIAGIDAHVASAADQFVQVCGRAAAGMRSAPLQWAADAWYIAMRYTDLDWRVVIETAACSRLALPLSVQCDYLAEALSAAVPEGVRVRLRLMAADADTAACEAAVHAARAAVGGGGRSLLRATADRRARWRIMRWLLFPSAAYVRAGFAAPPASPLPVWYAARLVRAAGRRLVPRQWRRVAAGATLGVRHRRAPPTPR